MRGEFYPFQLGVYAARQDLAHVKVAFSGFERKGGGSIAASAFTCINLGGVDSAARPFARALAVPKGHVQALWCGVQVAEGARAGDYAGTATISVTTSDLGNTGGGGTRQDTDTIAITVTGTNDARPVITAPTAQSTTEDVARLFNATNGNLISIADIDATGLQVTLTVTRWRSFRRGSRSFCPRGARASPTRRWP